jgi:hypothetical protein
MKIPVTMIYLIIHLSNISINLSIIFPHLVKPDQHHSLHRLNSLEHCFLAHKVDTPGVCVHMGWPAPADNEEFLNQIGQVSDYQGGPVFGFY